MAMRVIPSDRTIKALDSTKNRLNDGNGLHLRRGKDGMFWYQDVTFKGRRFTLSLGPYPEVGLAAARLRSDELRAEAYRGVNLYEMRKAEKATIRMNQSASRLLGRSVTHPDALHNLAIDWYGVRASGWSEAHAKRVMSRLENHVFPVLGHMSISSIQSKEITALLMKVDASGKNETANRVLSICRRVFDFAIAKGSVMTNPCHAIKEVLRSPIVKHHAAITQPIELQSFVKCAHLYTGTMVVRCALLLLLMTFLRSSEFRWAKWSEIDLDGQVWMVPAERMKQIKQKKLDGEPHLVPLSTQAVNLLKDLKALTGHQEYVFLGQGWKNPVISENTINQAIRRMGYSTQNDMTTHGFRATARTMLVEQLGVNEKVAEMQLDHKVPDANGDAYNRVEYLRARVRMMQMWSDYLHSISIGAIPEPVQPHIVVQSTYLWSVAQMKVLQPASSRNSMLHDGTNGSVRSEPTPNQNRHSSR